MFAARLCSCSGLVASVRERSQVPDALCRCVCVERIVWGVSGVAVPWGFMGSLSRGRRCAVEIGDDSVSWGVCGGVVGSLQTSRHVMSCHVMLLTLVVDKSR